VETLPSDAFRKDQLLRDGTWIVAFLADWCPFCRRFQPQFQSLEGGSRFHPAIADVTFEESPLWEDFGIEVIPALIVFRDGRAVFRQESDPGQGLPPGSLERARLAASGTEA